MNSRGHRQEKSFSAVAVRIPVEPFFRKGPFTADPVLTTRRIRA